MHQVVALVPMKAHSERVPGKNFRTFCGKPLFRWIVDALLSVDIIDQVVINTDARDLLREHGLVTGERILVRDRPTELCGDFVSMNAVLADDIENVAAETYVMTHTTNPLLQAGTIETGIREYRESIQAGFDSLFSVTRVQTRFYQADGSPINHDPDNLVRTQDLEPWFEEDSNLYVFSGASFRATAARIGRRPALFEVPHSETMDIDTEEDWNVAEAVASHLNVDGGVSE
ncbi:MAG: acylneuraminate cytidylyltransferase family protein [Longimicrobiales bacterium]|nr:acylneuraminate cytidylyltransferase family protein [Longimicrobiales bacterium]